MQPDRKASILLVDDEPGPLPVLEATLREPNQPLVRARGAREALRCLLKEDFAVILLDARPSGPDTLELARLIREQERSRATPILFLVPTGRAAERLFRETSLGPMDCLVKPFVPEAVSARVSAFVELYRQTKEVLRLDEHSRRKEQELAASGRRRDEFLALLSHELRNPLAALVNGLRVMRLADGDATQVEKARELAERQVGLLAGLVDDLLDAACLNRGTIQLNKQPVDLAEVVARAVESSGPILKGRGHRLEVELPPGPVQFEADPVRLEQVLVNLLNNAARYTEPNGRVRLSAAREGNALVLRVRDSGVGLPADMLERAFDLFAQADRSRSSSYQWGLGVGLALVRRVVELHGGTVQATSAGPGQGSEFVVRLPLRSKKSGVRPASAVDTVRSTGRTLRVLVVDDNQYAAESLAMLLRLKGHAVVTASDGRTALEAASADPPEVVLLDIGMPRMDGYEVARRLRARPEMQQALLVATTGFGLDEDRQRARQAGFDYHLVKPVDPVTIEDVLARFAESGGSGRERSPV